MVAGWEIRFGADGTGELVGYSAFSGPSQQRFRWRMQARGVLGFLFVDDEDEAGGPEAGEEPAGPDEWESVPFAIEPVTTDYCTSWALRTVGAWCGWLQYPIIPDQA
jgi:hypothetical protein